MIETVIVLLIVAAAAVIIGRKFYKTLSGKGGGCGCGCSCGKKPDAPSCCDGHTVKR